MPNRRVRTSLPSLALFATRALALAAVLSPLGASLGACSTDAVGIDACRSIETARCRAAPSCQGSEYALGIASETEVENCVLFYNDHCLLGIENDVAEPAEKDVNDCVKAIETLAKCAKAGTDDAAECEGLALVKDAGDRATCEVLTAPELIDDCAFVQLAED